MKRDVRQSLEFLEEYVILSTEGVFNDLHWNLKNKGFLVSFTELYCNVQMWVKEKTCYFRSPILQLSSVQIWHLPCPALKALKATTAGTGRPSESKVLVLSHIKTQFSLSTVHSCSSSVSKENEIAGLVWYWKLTTDAFFFLYHLLCCWDDPLQPLSFWVSLRSHKGLVMRWAVAAPKVQSASVSWREPYQGFLLKSGKMFIEGLRAFLDQ